MIVRMWHGRVPTHKANAYREFLNQRAIPDYRLVPGNLSVHILERREAEITHFITLTFWKDLGSIEGFAGADIEMAKYSRRYRFPAGIRAKSGPLRSGGRSRKP